LRITNHEKNIFFFFFFFFDEEQSRLEGDLFLLNERRIGGKLGTPKKKIDDADSDGEKETARQNR